MVVRSLLAAERSEWRVEVLVGWVVDRGDWFWLVSWDVVVAVDIDTWNLLGENVEGPTAKTGGGTGWKNPLAGDGFGGEPLISTSVAFSRLPAVING